MMDKGRWARGLVEWQDGDTVNISIVFTWDVDDAWQRAQFWKSQGFHIRVGGPGAFVNRKIWKGLADVGGDVEDAVSRHNPMATFASRGCPVGCWFCIVPAMEGKEFTLIPDFTPRPVLCDNNLSALEDKYQDHIISRYLDADVPLLDANSGFEPATFDEVVFKRWEKINKGAWRFAYDEIGEREDVLRCLKMLKHLPGSKKRVYTLIGNEPFESCMGRIQEVISNGGEPHAQPVMKLNARVKRPWVRYDWTEQRLRDVARWCNRYIWRKVDFADYDRSYKTGK